MYGKMTGGSAVAPMWARYYQTLINKGLYTPGKFEFLENYLETGDLVKQNIDIYTGLLDGPNSKEMVIRKGRTGKLKVQQNIRMVSLRYLV